MKLRINERELKFKNFTKKDKSDYKDLPKCDVNGKELEWESGNRGHYVYKENEEKFEGTRTDVYRKKNGEVLEKAKRTESINLEEEARKMDMREAMAKFNPLGEKYCVNDKGVFDDLEEGKCYVFTVMLSRSYEYNLKVALVYKQDDVVVMRLNSPVSKKKQIEEEKVSVDDKIDELKEKKEKVKNKTELKELGL